VTATVIYCGVYMYTFGDCYCHILWCLHVHIWWLLLSYTVVFTCTHFPLFWNPMPR